MLSSSNWRRTMVSTLPMGLFTSMRSLSISALRPKARSVLMISAARSTWALISTTT